jgi:tRNA(Ile)-lysidine synthase
MTPEALARLFQPWERAGRILLAVSGGPDSMALLHLAAEWSRTVTCPPLFAATVDHGLRPAAQDEARLVARAAQDLGIPHEILHWRGDKPASAIQEKAREARYGLLADLARRLGANVLMTAHHADDQAETILFRLSRGSGVTGLGGMRAESRRDGLILARPLLGLRKAQLVDICRERLQIFAEDPSNADPRYGRVQIRALLAELDAKGVQVDWTRLGARLSRADEALSAVSETLFERARDRDGSINFTLLAAEPEEMSLRVLALFLEKAGARLPLSLEKLEALNERLRRAAAEKEISNATLAGLRIELDARGVLHWRKERQRKRGLGPKQEPEKNSPENRLSLSK